MPAWHANDESFISVGCAVGMVIDEPATVWASKGEGVTCEKRTRIVFNDLPLPSGRPSVTTAVVGSTVKVEAYLSIMQLKTRTEGLARFRFKSLQD